LVTEGGFLALGRTAVFGHQRFMAEKVPNPKFQIPRKPQIANSKVETTLVSSDGDWDFLGAWVLGFGIS
jgi:hypothetical protein